MPFLPLDALGERIMILGPSNAGKSTLACAIAAERNLPLVHLDQLQHLPNTNWQPRPEAEFKALHDHAIQAATWVMDGNYSRHMPQRFQRATGVILITSGTWLRLARYIKRTLVSPSARAGSLEGGQETLKWSMIDWILFKTPNNARRYASMVETTSLPTVTCHTIKELKALYNQWGLRGPSDNGRSRRA